jgi:hypothetical protein
VPDPVFSWSVFIVSAVAWIVARRALARSAPLRRMPPSTVGAIVSVRPTVAAPPKTLSIESADRPGETTRVRVGGRQIVVETARLSPLE